MQATAAQLGAQLLLQPRHPPCPLLRRSWGCHTLCTRRACLPSQAGCPEARMLPALVPPPCSSAAGAQAHTLKGLYVEAWCQLALGRERWLQVNVTLGQQREPSFLSINPVGKIPAIGGWVGACDPWTAPGQALYGNHVAGSGSWLSRVAASRRAAVANRASLRACLLPFHRYRTSEGKGFPRGEGGLSQARSHVRHPQWTMMPSPAGCACSSREPSSATWRVSG